MFVVTSWTTHRRMVEWHMDAKLKEFRTKQSLPETRYYPGIWLGVLRKIT
jgi:hypothetical protein